MNKLHKYMFCGLLLLAVSCSDFSKLCRHGAYSKGSFVYRGQQESPKRATLFRDAVYRQDAESGFYLTTYTTETITWKMLMDVSYQKKFNKEYNMDILYPLFGKTVKPLNKKELSITGYMIPLDVGQGLYAISKNPYTACFFCGRSGPESVVSLKFNTQQRRFKTDEFLTVKGTMELNDKDVDDFIYIFRNASVVENQ